MKALLLIDLQIDFAPGGALPVPDGDEVVLIANKLIPHFPNTVATQDWHPIDHCSFSTNYHGKRAGDLIEIDGMPQVLWPVHCVQNTHGSGFLPSLLTDRIVHVTRKGTDTRLDTHSAFFECGHRRSTDLNQYLTNNGIDDLVIMGLATDHCVKNTVIDGCKLGFNVVVATDGCRGIESH